jgi:hypothetical protein
LEEEIPNCFKKTAGRNQSKELESTDRGSPRSNSILSRAYCTTPKSVISLGFWQVDLGRKKRVDESIGYKLC